MDTLELVQERQELESLASARGHSIRMRHLNDDEAVALACILGSPPKRWVAVAGLEGRLHVLKAHTQDELMERVRAHFGEPAPVRS